MNVRSRLFSIGWVLVLCGAGAFLGWSTWARVQHVERATSAGQAKLKVAATSPTGYLGGTRELIVPEHNDESYKWIAQTQQMVAGGDWRVRRIDYENAPFGRAENSASPYRWWLGLLGWLDHLVSGRPLGLAIEHAALFADPLLQFLLLTGTTLFVAWRFGGFPAALLAAGLVAIFPWGGTFLPGAPTDQGLAWACGLWSVLLLVAGLHGRGGVTTAAENPQSGSQMKRWFFAAGLVGGVGLWIDVPRQTPILLGIVLGALGVLAGSRGPAPRPSRWVPGELPWRNWALGLALTSVAAYLVEYFPAHLGDWHLRSIHPIHGVAWLGLGEVLAQAGNFLAGKKPASCRRAILLTLLGLAGVASVPVLAWQTGNGNLLAGDFPSQRLTNLPNGVTATSTSAWLIREGFTVKGWTTLLPALLVLPAGWVLARRKIAFGPWAMVSLALGPVLVALGFAGSQLAWWNGVDAACFVLLVAAVSATTGPDRPAAVRWGWVGGVAVVGALGISQLLPPKVSATENTFNQAQVEGLIDRDLAQWLARRTDGSGAIVLATPRQTAALHYYAGLRGLGTLDLGNREGFGAAVRIASATTAEEALELVQRREVRFIVIPSWDANLDEYAMLGLGQVDGSFIDRLHRWALPGWVRPVAYQMPQITGFEGQSVTIFEVVENQSDPLSLSRIAEYFVEMGQRDQAVAVAQALKRFPADLGAQVARLEVELATGPTPEFEPAMNALVGRLARKADRIMPWDRRVGLAVVLARGKQMTLAQEQVQRCLTEMDEQKLRSLTTGSLYRLQVLAKAYGLPMKDQRLQALGLQLLPEELRNRL